MKYIPWVFLLMASPAFAQDRPSFFFTAEQKAEFRQLNSLSRLSIPELEAVAEQERACYNQQVLMDYNRMMPTQPNAPAFRPATARGRRLLR